MRSRRASEEGSALVTAILVTFLVLTLGLSAMATVDVQQRESRKQRERESTFQLSEAALNAQIFQLSRRWPGTSTGGYPGSCTQTSITVADCPTPSALTGAYTGPDYRQLSWVTTVRDNGGGVAQYYDAAVADLQPRWDANDDKMMWVRADARLVDPANAARFKTRTVVALVRADTVPVVLPEAALVVGSFATTNSGNKTIIDTNGVNSEWQPGPVVVRCNPAVTGCADYDNTKQRAQVDPDTVSSDPAAPSLSADKLDLLRSRAVAEGNYYATGCAPSLAGDNAGEIVFMESAATPCSYTANATYNGPENPGVVVIGSGSLRLAGNSAFYGLIYHANTSGSSAPRLVELGGNTTVTGSIQVAGPGGIYAGSSKVNLVYDPRSVRNIAAYGTAGIVQNSFRELRAGS